MRRVHRATHDLCEFIASVEFGDIPLDVIEHAKLMLLDGLGCALLASHQDWSRRAVSTVLDLEGTGRCAVWGSATRVAPTTAALLNGTLVQGFELDDYHPTGPLHSEACVIPAVFSLAEHLGGVTGKDFLTALIVGFEVGPRVGIASGGLRLVELGFHCGAIYGAIAAAAGCGRLLGLTADQCNDALGIGATQAAGLMGAQFGAMVKRMHSGKAAQSGVYAASLAADGYTGIRDVFDINYGGFTAFTHGEPLTEFPLREGLGEEWEARRIVIKPPYACMAGLHSSLDAIKEARSAGLVLHPDEVVGVDVGVSTAMFRHAGWRYDPAAGVMAAQMNLQYAVSRMIADGDLFVPEVTAQKATASDILSLIERVRPYADPEIDTYGHDGRWAVNMRIRLRGSADVHVAIRHPSGTAERRLTETEVVEKYFRMACTHLSAADAERLKDAVYGIENIADVSVLSNLF